MAIPRPRAIQELVFIVAAVVLVVSSPTSEAGYCVNPIEDEPCDCATALDACHTLDEYLSAPGDYFTTGATFRFMPGQHRVHRSFKGSDIVNLTFVKDRAEDIVRITLSAVSNISAWLVLSNSSGISLSGINFEMNSSAVNHTCYNFILEFHCVYDIEFSDTSCVSNCGGYVSISYGHNVKVSNATLSYSNHSGFYISNTTGSMTIERITFTAGSSAPSIFIYSSYYTLNCSLHSKLVIDVCLFQYVASGLELILEEMAGCLDIHVKNSLFTGLGDFGMELNSIPSSLLGSEWLFEVELDNNTFYNSTTVGIVLSLYVFNRMHINNCVFRDNFNTAVAIFMGHNPNATAYFENSLFINNRVPPGIINVPATALSIQNLEGCSEHSIQNFTFRNVSFIGNGHSTVETPTVVLCINHLKIIDCRFISNSGTPLQAVSSVLSLEGSIDFISNTARQGAAMYFYGESKMILDTSETNVTFTNNHAFLTGGAIQISNNNMYPPFSIPLCFLSLQEGGNTLLSFTNNTAGNGGDAIYGGVFRPSHVGH